MHNRPRVLIVGAGFGGLWAARTLAHSPVEVMLLDRNNYHTFLPLLYQIAAAELEPEDIAYPIRSIVRKWPHTSFCLTEVRRVEFAARTVQTDGPTIPYDFLILSMGSLTHFFGVKGAPEFAYPLKTMEQGIRLRNHVLSCFERAMHVRDAAQLQRILTFAIVGGGPTGVEFAGALAELVRRPLMKDFRGLDFRNVRVVLLEAMNSLLVGMPERLGGYAQRRLQKMGVDVRFKARVSEITPDCVFLKDGTIIPTETVVWTAGVRGDPAVSSWQLPTGGNGRVLVLPTLQLSDHREIYVIGDLASVEQDTTPLPMVAPVAMQQGVTAARNILREIAGRSPLAFHYRDRGTMVTIGRNAAVASLGGLVITGFAAWVIWLSVHLFKLIGFRNRLLVLINWAWDYFFYERAVRLILPLASSESAQFSGKAINDTPQPYLRRVGNARD